MIIGFMAFFVNGGQLFLLLNIAAIGTGVLSMLGVTIFNLSSLIFFRVLNRVFAIGISPVTIALVGENFDDKNMHKALGKVMKMIFLDEALVTKSGGALVYLTYVIGELIIALVIFKTLKRDTPSKQN